MRLLRPTALLLVALVAAACQEQSPVPPAGSGAAPAAPSGAWAPTPTADDPAVATVDGVPILLSQLQAAVDEDGGATPPRELLARLVEAELLARAARERGYADRPEVREAASQAMIRRLLEVRITSRPPESFFDERLLQSLYRIPSVRVLYDHADAFKVLDAQFTCCALRYDDCDPKEFEACMAAEAPKARAFYEYVRDKATNADDFRALVEEARLEYGRLASKEYSFFYDVDLPHAQQAGYDIVNENVAKAVMDLGVGRIAPPVASRNAWHVLLLLEHSPEERKTLADPEVRADIITKLLPKKQASEFDVWLQTLRRELAVELFPDEVETLFRDAEAID